MADNTNPFVGLVTPDMLRAQREQEAMQSAGSNIWQQMAAKAGLGVRENLINSGFGSAEDQKAAAAQKIMQDATKKYSGYLAGGATADEAQAAVLEDAIKQFTDLGDYQSALAMTQPLNELKSQALERRKLKADAAQLEAKPDLMDAQAQAKIAEIAQKDQALTLKQQALDNALAHGKTMEEMQAARIELLRDRLALDREKAEQKAASGGDSVFMQKQKFQTDDRVLAAAEATDLMSDINKLIRANPGAATTVGSWATRLSGLASSGRAAISQNGYDLGTEDEKVTKALLKYNISDVAIQSKALDLAYAFARVRDPGGRLSNQDVNMALEIVMGKGDPRAQLAVLRNNYVKMKKDTDNLIKMRTSQKVHVDEEALRILSQAQANYEASDPAFNKPKAAAPAPAAPSALPAGWKVTQRTQ